MRERFRERWRDKTRDNLTSALNSLGVRAKMAERGRAEEEVRKRLFTRSLGVVDIPEGSIRWINVVKQDGGQHNPPRWWLVFCVPDEERDTTPDDLREVDARQTIDIKTIRTKSFPLFGRVTGIAWDGDDRSTGLLNASPEIRPSRASRRRPPAWRSPGTTKSSADGRCRWRGASACRASTGKPSSISPITCSRPRLVRTRHRPARRCSGGDSSMV